MDLSLVETLLAVAFAIIGFGGFLLIWVRRRLKAKIAALRADLAETPEVADDRAHNQLAMARAESDLLRRQGVDVTPAGPALAEAEAAAKRGDSEGTLRAAQRAHEKLLELRTLGSRRPAGTPFPSMTSSPPDRSRPPVSNVPNGAPPAASDSGSPADPPVPKLAKNRAESHFQLGLLQDEIDRAAKERPADGAILEARDGAQACQSAYDRADYTEALRLALRARRKLGAQIESLPAPTTRIPPSTTPLGPTASSSPAGTAPCASCGRPLKLADRFCRACGTARLPTACPSCGTPLETDDRFCAGCGAAVS